MRQVRKMRRAACGLVGLGLLAAHVPPAHGEDLLGYSLDDLLTLESTSVIRKRQRIADSPGAITILTQEDILRSGARTITDVLRLVPGVEVGQIDNASTAVSIRGFNTRFANNLLVMIDGRSLYVSALSGVLWDQQLVPLSEIERIEVVRGPGAALWGTNAVNGVINIITKESIQSQGLATTVQAGTDAWEGTVRYGASTETASVRVYATARTTDSLESQTPAPPLRDPWAYQAGFRFDAAGSDNDTLTIQGDIQKGAFATGIMQTPPNVEESGYYPFEGNFTGANILGRWSHQWDDDKDFTLQAYLDHVTRDEFGASVRRTIADVDTTFRVANARSELVLGLNLRRGTNAFGNNHNFVSFRKPHRDTHWLSGFVQEAYWLTPSLRLSLGSKFEYNTTSGTFLQPSLRVLWKADPAFSLWAAYSRAVRTPAQYENTVQVDLGLPAGNRLNPLPYPVVAHLEGSDDIAPEKLDAFEVGMRGQITQSLSYDIAAYLNYYRDMIGYEVRGSSFNTRSAAAALLLDYTTTNIGRSKTFGVEATVKAELSRNFRLQLAYVYKDIDFTVTSPAGVEGTILASSGRLSPSHQGSIRASYDAGSRLELDAWLRYVGALPYGDIPAYYDLDLRVAYALTPGTNIALIGQNVLEKQRLEYAQPYYPALRSYVGRSISVRLGTRF